MREVINWRQLYMESQAIRPEDSSVSIQRICRLVNIYKNDMIEQDLQRHVQRLTRVPRCCSTCAASSYTTYRWLDTVLAGETNLLDLQLAGRSVTAFVYFWHKTLFDQRDERGRLSDFQQENQGARYIGGIPMSSWSITDENVIIQKKWWRSILPKFIHRWMMRFRMYYTYRRALSLCQSIQVHSQPMKTFRSLLQTNIAPIFVCFVHDDNSFRQLFWTFRHLITALNWPSTTKIFANRTFRIDSVFERMMVKHAGLIDLSQFDMHRADLFAYLYRCLRTCGQNGPMVFLFDHSAVLQPKSADSCLLAFLCDLIRFDLSIPDVLIIPTRLSKPRLAFSQPFLFKETIEFFAMKMNIQKPLCELFQSKERELVDRFARCLLHHLAYSSNIEFPLNLDTAQLETMPIGVQHLIACIDLCQTPGTQESSSPETILSSLHAMQKTCPSVIADAHHLSEITMENVKKYQSNGYCKAKLISEIRKEYFLETIAALCIVSKVQHFGGQSRVFESDMVRQMALLLITFVSEKNLSIRPCQDLAQIIQEAIRRCQLRSYIAADHVPQKPMRYRETIESDHDWSDDDDDDVIGDSFVDQDEDGDEITMGDPSIKLSEATRTAYRINFGENHYELRFFARLLGPHVEALVHALDYHLDRHMTTLTLVEFQPPELFHFGETAYLNPDDVLSQLRRAYAYQLVEHATLSDELPMLFQPADDQVYPLARDKLTSLREQFFTLFDCCCVD